MAMHWCEVASRVVMPPEHAQQKIPLWRFQSKLEAVFKPYIKNEQSLKKNESQIQKYREENEGKGEGKRLLGKVARRVKEREENEAKDVDDVSDFTTIGRIRRVCSCSAEHRSPGMLKMLDSVLGNQSPFFMSFHKSWRTELLKRVELVELKKPGVTLFSTGDDADAAFFVASGRLSNKILVGNKATKILEDTAESANILRHRGSFATRKQNEKTADMREYMQLDAFHPGSEIDLDCLRTTKPGGKIRTVRGRTCESIDPHTTLFKLSKQAFDETCAFCDKYEDTGIKDFFLHRTPGGISKKIFSKMPEEVLADFVSCWHLQSYPKHHALALQGKRVTKIYILAVGSLQVIRKQTFPKSDQICQADSVLKVSQRMSLSSSSSSSLLVVDQPRVGEFVQTGTSCIAAAVLEEPSSRPVYKCKCQTSLITTSASDLLVADASKFWEFCYAHKSFAKILLDYFSAINLEFKEALKEKKSHKQWNRDKKGIVSTQVRKLSRSGELQSGTTAPSKEDLEKMALLNATQKEKRANRAIRKRQKRRMEKLLQVTLDKRKLKEEAEKRMVKSISLPLLKNTMKERKLKGKMSLFETSKGILSESMYMYDRLRKTKSNGATSPLALHKGKHDKGQPSKQSLARVKKRLEDSMLMHKRRYGSHRLIRGPELRFFADQRYEKFLVAPSVQKMPLSN